MKKFFASLLLSVGSVDATFRSRGRSAAIEALEFAASLPQRSSITVLTELARKVGLASKEDDLESVVDQGPELPTDSMIDASKPLSLFDKKEIEDIMNTTLADIDANDSAPVRTQPVVMPKRSMRATTTTAQPSTSSKLAKIEHKATAPTIAPSDMESAIADLLLDRQAFSASPMGSSIDKMKELVEKTMMVAVKDSHDADQKELDKLVEHMSACKDVKTLGFEKVTEEKAKYETNSKLHKTCRANEAVKYTTKKNCFTEQAQKKQIKELKCKSYATTSRRIGDGNRNRQIVRRGGSESVESYVKRITATVCGHPGGGGNGGSGKGGLLDDFLNAKDECEKATRDYNNLATQCKRSLKDYTNQKMQCDVIQEKMDSAACTRAVHAKDACETYAECYKSTSETYKTAEKTVMHEEKDRKAEMRGLRRMSCLLETFSDGKVDQKEVDKCKNTTQNTDDLVIKYPSLANFEECTVPLHYPSTPEYKQAEFAALPAMAKGKEPEECTGVQEVSTSPREGSPASCKCKRVTLNGPYAPGPLVKCTDCLDVRRTTDKNSCPLGTKIFSPTSQQDWQTFIKSAGPLRQPNFIIDITRPQNGCGGCTASTMNSVTAQQKSWKTQDGSPWWLRSTRYNEPNGDYQANCYLDLWHTPTDPAAITWNDNKCNYHSKSYYCQPKLYNTKPKKGSPSSCTCKKVVLTGPYSAKALVKCEQCLSVSKSIQKNSCPEGMKIFSPASRSDWRTFLKSAGPLRAPNWIIDVTRPSNGCGGCTKYSMKSTTPMQATWRTADGTPWWLRSTTYSEPNGDYHANCYMDLWHAPHNEDDVRFNDGSCSYHSCSYYCQPAQKQLKH